MSTNYIDQITDTAGTTHDISEGDSTRIFRATCSTAASTAAKVATLDTSNRNFSLTTGVRVAVTFKYGNSATTPTLRVDGSSTGTAKTIAFPSEVAAVITGDGSGDGALNTWGPYETVIFTYNGTYWINGGSALGIYNVERVADDAYSLAASKTSNTGTVTSVGITNGGGLSISGSPVTTSGSITVGHSNSVTAQTTQAVYPIKIDAQGHISAYGSAVTIPVDEQVKQDSLNGTNSARNILVTNSAQTTASTTSSVNYARYFTYNDSVPSFTLTNISESTKQISISSTTISVKHGSNTTSINFTTPTTNRSITFPNNDGTVALTSDIPTVPSITLNGSSTTSPSFYAPTGAGTSGYVLKSNGSGAPTWTSAALTDEELKVGALSSAVVYYPILASNVGTATRQIDSTFGGFKYVSTAGTTSTIGTASLRLGNNIASGTGNNEKGIIRLYGSTSYRVDLDPGSPTSDFTLTLPNKSGTVALTSDITDEKLKTDRISTEFSYFPVLTRDTTSAGTKFYDSNFEYISNDGTSTTPYIAGQSILRLGNSITSGTENRAGWLQLYGSNNYNITLSSGSPTGNRTVILPDGNGTLALTSDITDTKVSTAAISVSTNYYPVLGTNTTSATTKYYDSSGLRYVYSIDSESNMGLAELILGNGESPDTTGNKKGLITFYSNNDKRVFLRATNDLTASVSIALPSTAGTLALTSQLSNYVAKSGDTMTGALVMTNGLYFMSTHKNESTTRIVCGISTDNTYMFGYGSRASETGSSFFDGHVVNIRSNGLVNITAPDGVTNTGTYNDLVKITSLPVAPGQINASSYKTATTTITAVSGYKPVGIIGYSSSSSNVVPFTYYLSSDTSLYTEFKNVSSSAITPTFSFKILWLKATGTRS